MEDEIDAMEVEGACSSETKDASSWSSECEVLARAANYKNNSVFDGKVGQEFFKVICVIVEDGPDVF